MGKGNRRVWATQSLFQNGRECRPERNVILSAAKDLVGPKWGQILRYAQNDK